MSSDRFPGPVHRLLGRGHKRPIRRVLPQLGGVTQEHPQRPPLHAGHVTAAGRHDKGPSPFRVPDLPVMAASAAGIADRLCRQQTIWSQTANKLKRDLTRWRAATLALTITGAVRTSPGTRTADASPRSRPEVEILSERHVQVVQSACN